jgi:two-component system sensor histidine kinase HydH
VINKNLRWRLSAPILIVGTLIFVFGALAAVYVHNEYQRRAEYVRRQFAGLNALQNLFVAERDVRYFLREFLLRGDATQIEEARQLREASARFANEAESLAVTETGRELIRRIRAGEQRVQAGFEELREGTLPAKRQRVLELLEILENELITPTRQYFELKLQYMDEGLGRTQQFAQLLVFTMTILGLCGATAGLLYGLAVTRGIGRSLVQLSVPIRNAAGQLNEAVGPLTVQTHWQFEELPDVVEQMAEQVGDVIDQMRASQRRAERSEQLAAAGQLAAGMAHELRNPLTSMKLLVQTGQQRAETGAGLSARDLSILAEEIERLERVVTTILDYARPPQAKVSEIDLIPVVEKCAELMADRYRRRAVKLEVELPSAPKMVRGDASQLRQVLLNVLLNALDASLANQTVTVRLAADTQSPRGQKNDAVIEVLDQGPGLPADPDVDIFEPFVSTKDTGLGLGLSISRQIAEAHGGTLTAANRTEGGAVVRLQLPFDGAELQPATAVAAGPVDA